VPYVGKYNVRNTIQYNIRLINVDRTQLNTKTCTYNQQEYLYTATLLSDNKMPNIHSIKTKL